MKRSLNIALVFAACLVVLAGCGRGSKSLSSVKSTQASDGEAAREASAAFLKPKSQSNQLVRFGSEASPEVRESASTVLEENLAARELAHFAIQCETLDAKSIESVVKSEKKSGAAALAACPQALQRLAEPLQKTAAYRVDTLQGHIAALRVNGNHAFALYHGNDGKDYVMPMTLEHLQWKVGSLLSEELG